MTPNQQRDLFKECRLKVEKAFDDEMRELQFRKVDALKILDEFYKESNLFNEHFKE